MKPDRQLVLNKTNGRCAYCGCELTGKWQLDHKIPQWYLNSTPPYATHSEVHCFENYMPSCCSCNNYKSGNPIESFRKLVQSQPEILKRDRPTVRLAERFGLIEFKEKPVAFYFEMLL